MPNVVFASRRMKFIQLFFITVIACSIVAIFESSTATNAQTNTTSLRDFAVFGTNGVILQKTDSIASGYIGSNDDILMADEITVAASSIVFAPNLEIRGITRVQTAYFTNLSNNSAVVNRYPFPTTPLVTFPTVPTVTPGTQNITVAAGQSQSLAAGSYSALLVQSGGTLVLSGGTYHFSNITLERNARLSFSAATEVRVANRLSADDDSVIAPQSGTAVTANQILIGVYGRNASEVEVPVAEFMGDNTVSATVYVPNGNLNFGGRGQLQGAFIGNWVYMGVETRISLASYFANAIAAPTATPTLPPTATTVPPTVPPTATPTLPPTATTVPPTVAPTLPPTATTVPPTVAPTLPPPTTSTTATSLRDFAVFGTNGVMLQKTERINSGYVGSHEDVIMADEMTVAAASSVFAPILEIRGSTTVQTAYFTNLNNASSVVNEYPFPSTPLVTFPAAPSITIGTQNITVSNSQSRTLAAGSYNDLVIGSSGIAVLTGGVYHFNNITLQRDAQIRFTGATEIRMAGRIYADSRSVIAPQSGTTVTPQQILVGIYRQNAAETETPVADFRGSNIVSATIYVPNGILNEGGRSQILGAFIGKWVRMGVESQVSLASYFTNTTVTSPVTPPTALPTATLVPPTAIPVLPTATLVPPTATPVTTTGSVFYVSRNGNNADGRSWATAWNELNRIDWTQIRPGTTIYIDGGTTSMMYQTTLTIGASGLAGQPIRIQRATTAGRSGRVVMFGGRTTSLPYCGQATYDDSASANFREQGIHTNNHRFVTIDGMGWRGIEIHGFKRAGIRIERGSTDITVRNVEIRNNGRAFTNTSGWRSDYPGVILAGVNTTFQRAIIHDNGADAFQSMWDDNNISNFRLEQSWLYNSRRHPSVNESFNYCTHSDGIQLYDGGLISGITVTETIFGPGFTQNLMFGEPLNSSGSWADIQNVTFRDVIFSRGADNGVHNKHNTNSSNWVLDRVTIDCVGTKYNCLHIDNSNHTVRNSVIVYGYIWLHDGLNTYSGNCTWNTTGFALGQSVNPSFVSFHSTDMFALNDYTVRASGCTGSRITSVNQLLSMP
jgi:hypothetical protein